MISTFLLPANCFGSGSPDARGTKDRVDDPTRYDDENENKDDR